MENLINNLVLFIKKRNTKIKALIIKNNLDIIKFIKKLNEFILVII